MALELTSAAKTSRLFNGISTDSLRVLATQNVTMNFHHDGVKPSTYESNPKLKLFYNILSLNVDRKGPISRNNSGESQELGVAFISTMEAKEWPIYGVQWHPERNQYEFYPDCNAILLIVPSHIFR